MGDRNNQAGTSFEAKLVELSEQGEDYISSKFDTLRLNGYNCRDNGAEQLAPLLKIKYLVRLELEDNNIGPKGCAAIAKSLKDNVFLRELFLGRNEFGCKGAKELSTVLRLYNETLELLDVSDTNCAIDGAKAYGEMLKKNVSLRHLNLSRNAITADGATHIFHGLHAGNHRDPGIGLLTLNLGHCHLGNSGARQAQQMLMNNETLEELDLSGNEIQEMGAEYIAKGLKSNKALVKINLSGNHILDAGIKYFSEMLSSNTTLKMLWLNDCFFNEDGLEILCQKMTEANQIEELHIAQNTFDEESVTKFIVNKLLSGDHPTTSLTSLDLSNCSLSSGDVIELGKLLGTRMSSTLKYLGLADNHIDDKTIEEFSRHMRNNIDLLTLDLLGNDFGPEGTRHLAKCFERNKNLRELRLTGLKIEAKGQNYLAKTLTINSNLTIKGVANELDYLCQCVHHGKCFVLNEEGELAGWSSIAWKRVEQGVGAIIGAAISKLDSREREEFARNVARKSRGKTNQTMLEHLIRYGEAPVLDSICTYMAACDMTLDERTGSSTQGRKHTYRYVAVWYAKDTNVKAFAQDRDLILDRYKPTFGPVTYQTDAIKQIFAYDLSLIKDESKTDLEANVGVLQHAEVMVRIHYEEDDYRREQMAREDLQYMLGGDKNPLALKDIILESIEFHDEWHAVSFRRGKEDLHTLINNQWFGKRRLRAIAQEMATRLGGLNNLGRCHGNFKPRNLIRVSDPREVFDEVLHKNVSRDDKWVLMDLTKSVKHGEKVAVAEDSGYMAPEVARVMFSSRLNEKQLPMASEKMDVWAFGVILYEMVTGMHLFTLEKPTDKVFRQDERAELMNWLSLDAKRKALIDLKLIGKHFPKHYRTNLINLINQCLQSHPNDRPCFHEILTHPFFVEIKHKRPLTGRVVDVMIPIYKDKKPEEILFYQTHMHFANTACREVRDVTKSLSFLFREVGCATTTDILFPALSMDDRKFKIEKARTLCILLTKDVFFKPHVMQQLIWAMDFPGMQIILIDLAQSSTAKPMDFNEFWEQFKPGNPKFEHLVHRLHPFDEKIGEFTSDLPIGTDEKGAVTKYHIAEFLQTTVGEKIAALEDRRMPFRSEDFEARAMLTEILERSDLISPDLVQPFKVEKDINSGGPIKKAKVLICYKEGITTLKNDVFKLRQKMLGFQADNCTVELVKNGKTLVERHIAPDNELEYKFPTVIIAIVTDGFFQEFGPALNKVHECDGQIVIVPVAYEFDPSNEGSKEEIEHFATEKENYELFSKRANYVPFHPNNKAQYEFKASLNAILHNAQKRLRKKMAVDAERAWIRKSLEGDKGESTSRYGVFGFLSQGLSVN